MCSTVSPLSPPRILSDRENTCGKMDQPRIIVASKDDGYSVPTGRYTHFYTLAASNAGGKMSNSSISNYELSGDFQQKQLEMLEKKYGGHLRAQRAALVLQRAYRKHSLSKKWNQVRNSSRKRLTRYQTAAELGENRQANGNLTAFLSGSELQKFCQFRVKRFTEPDLLSTTSPSLNQIKLPKIQVRQPQSYSAVGGLKLHKYSLPGDNAFVDRPAKCQVDTSATQSKEFHTSGSVPVNLPAFKVAATSHNIRAISVERNALIQNGDYKRIFSPRESNASSPTIEKLDNTNCSRAAELAFDASSSKKAGHTLHEPLRIPQIPIRATDFRQTGANDDGVRVSAFAVGSPRIIGNTPVVCTPTVSYKHPNGAVANCLSPVLRRKPHIVNSPSTSLENAALSKSVPDCSTILVSSLKSPPGVPRSQDSRLRGEEKEREIERKRQYRIALNHFNKKPDQGMKFLMDFGFVEAEPRAVARFLLTRRGLSKQMIGDYLGNLQQPFNGAVLYALMNEINLCGMDIDVALRYFLTLFRLPGEAQKIERIIEVFAARYWACNQDKAGLFGEPDRVFILAFAIIMLNTDLHSPNIKPQRRMKPDEFVKNLRGIEGGEAYCKHMLTGIYHRLKEQEFKPGTDHVAQVLKVDRSIVGTKKPTLALPHRRLVCYCRLYEIDDPQKKQTSLAHQREIFLFNDLVVVTKILNKKRGVPTYAYRQSYSLVGMHVQLFKNQYYTQGIKITHTLENKTLFFHARNEEDKQKFLEDLQESIIESDEMETLRIELELEKQSSRVRYLEMHPPPSSAHYACGGVKWDMGKSERDSGLTDESARDASSSSLSSSVPQGAPRAAHQTEEGAVGSEREMQKRSSVNSLDSGMSSTASVESRDYASASNERPRVDPFNDYSAPTTDNAAKTLTRSEHP